MSVMRDYAEMQANRDENTRRSQPCYHVFPDGTVCRLTDHSAPGLAEVHTTPDLPELTAEDVKALDSQSRYGRSEVSLQLAVRRIIARHLARG